MKKILWLIPGLALAGSVLAQQLTNPPPSTTIEPPAPAPALAVAPTNAAPPPAPAAAPKKKAAKKAPKATPKKNAASALRTTPLAPGIATVVASNVNVRGQAKLRSEVVTRITREQQVTVLEEIVRNDSAADEPSAWAKILLPNNATVWVHMNYLSNNTVTATVLNLRSGPGENYSVLGRLPRGSVVTTISTRDNWMQIPAPADAYGFVAAQYLKQEPGTGPMIAAAATSSTTTASVLTEPPPAPYVPDAPATPLMPETPTTAETVKEAPVVAPAPGEVPPPPAPVQTEAPVVAMAPATATSVDTNEVPVEEEMDEPPPRRIVQREGIVRGTGSIQAPSHFALVSPVNGKLINYLYTTSPSLDLRRYKGFHIIVTGEEALEERWGNTPVITIEKLDVLDE